jgi:hypothetical protein
MFGGLASGANVHQRVFEAMMLWRSLVVNILAGLQELERMVCARQLPAQQQLLGALIA